MGTDEIRYDENHGWEQMRTMDGNRYDENHGWEQI
jgi:hypothetical protein